MAGLWEELAEQPDPVGCISDRFHGPVALTRQTALATISSGVAEVGVAHSYQGHRRRHRRGRRRHKKGVCKPHGTGTDTVIEQ
jgi:hypothetical protein